MEFVRMDCARVHQGSLEMIVRWNDVLASARHMELANWECVIANRDFREAIANKPSLVPLMEAKSALDRVSALVECASATPDSREWLATLWWPANMIATTAVSANMVAASAKLDSVAMTAVLLWTTKRA